MFSASAHWAGSHESSPSHASRRLERCHRASVSLRNRYANRPAARVFGPGFPAAPAAAAQQTMQQAVQLLRQALSALGVSSPINDITLSGTAHYVAGSDDETETATLKAISGAS